MGVSTKPPPAPMRVPNAPISTPMGNHRYSVMRSPVTWKGILQCKFHKARATEPQSVHMRVVHVTICICGNEIISLEACYVLWSVHIRRSQRGSHSRARGNPGVPPEPGSLRTQG